jgi:hypothetical protein
MARSKKSKPSSRMEALAEALSALSAWPLEVVLSTSAHFRRARDWSAGFISTVVAKDKATVIKVYQEEPVRDGAVPLAPPRRARGAEDRHREDLIVQFGQAIAG